MKVFITRDAVRVQPGADVLVVEICDGLREGEAVMLHPSEHIDDGSPVQPW
jgi:hypothetical protein